MIEVIHIKSGFFKTKNMYMKEYFKIVKNDTKILKYNGCLFNSKKNPEIKYL